MPVNKIKLKGNLWFIVFSICSLFIIFGTSGDVDIVKITSAMISVISLLNLFRYDVKFGFNKVFFVFIYIFLGLAPVFQYADNFVMWGGNSFSKSDYIHTNVLLLCVIVFYTIIYNFNVRNTILFNGKKIDVLPFKENNEYKISGAFLVIISSISFIYTLYVLDFNIMALLLRGIKDELISGGDALISDASTLSALIFTGCIRPIPILCLIIFKCHRQKNKMTEFSLILLSLLSNFPLSIARFMAAALYTPLLFFYSKWIRQYFNFQIFLILAVFILFPLMNLARTLGSASSISFDMFCSGHFDSYQSLMRVVSENFVLYGRQLLGVLLFFVPRSIWPTKPLGSGYVIADEFGYYFDNISMNYFGEGYINFGIIGVFLFATFLAYYNALFDKSYWKKGQSNPIFSSVFYILMTMEFIILRGALQNVFPLAVAYVIVLLCLNCGSSVVARVAIRVNKERVLLNV